MSGRSLYKQVCEASNLDAAVSQLNRDELAELAEYISKLKPRGGVPAQVSGMVAARISDSAKPKARKANP
ncbi:hypothetical protein JIN85_16970 [Luteolibacter pohnpeiensis]|uniref:Uncharacterized protein n=1 Tax=Luteolibacter pohnpeiensis TaxID=454153 RepID=A0A934SA07_9BACT|nr:hypothetical protein [Luteolibacter pohnpeiensis]MBK1884115.1 hypothetical protein [Luteolibacter pohnpeiensis]